MVFDDSGARRDWGWRHEYDLDGLVKVMFQYLAPKFGKILPELHTPCCNEVRGKHGGQM